MDDRMLRDGVAWLLVLAAPLVSGPGDSAEPTAAGGVAAWHGQEMGSASSVVTYAGDRAVRADGARIYAGSCQACHQADGRGMPGVFPPLAGSEWVTGDAATLIRILLDGMQGPVSVAGSAYVGVMPGWRDLLTDEELAAVASYIRGRAPNSADPVSTTDVRFLRAATAERGSPWTASELRPGSTADAARRAGIGQHWRPAGVGVQRAGQGGARAHEMRARPCGRPGRHAGSTRGCAGGRGCLYRGAPSPP